MFSKDLKDGEFCPLVRDACVRHKCAWFTKVVGKDPQSEILIDKFACAIAWLPTLTIENSQQQRSTCATVDKVANQIKKQRAEFIGALPPEAIDRMVKNNVKLLNKEDDNGTERPI